VNQNPRGVGSRSRDRKKRSRSEHNRITKEDNYALDDWVKAFPYGRNDTVAEFKQKKNFHVKVLTAWVGDLYLT